MVCRVITLKIHGQLCQGVSSAHYSLEIEYVKVKSFSALKQLSVAHESLLDRVD